MRNKKTKSVIVVLLITLLLLGCFVGILNIMFSSVPLEGYSMENTLHDGDRVIVYKTGNYQLGDVVMFDTSTSSEDGEEVYLVKRIIAWENDEISIYRDDKDGKCYVWVNGKRLTEDYLGSQMDEEMPSMVVPEGCFFYLGDNRSLSKDSRKGVYGKIDNIIGRVIIRYDISKENFDVGFIWR